MRSSQCEPRQTLAGGSLPRVGCAVVLLPFTGKPGAGAGLPWLPSMGALRTGG
jgi:hypothetical protein